MKSMLITGHRGFVGRHFYEFFSYEYEILGIDLLNGHDCRDFFKRDTRQWDVVIHLAAIVGGRKNIDKNPLSVATDLSIDAEMFNWAMRTKPKQLVYFSSSAAYPNYLQNYPNMCQLGEKDIIFDPVIYQPDMTYGWAKLTGEYLATFLLPEIKTLIFRPFSGYGSDQSTDYPFPKFIERAIRKDDPFVVWGPGSQKRDFIHINDIVSAVHTALKLGMVGTYNLGTGVPISFLELAKMICKEAGYMPTFQIMPEMPSGVDFRVADIRKMFSFYKPIVSLEDGIRMALT